MIVSNALTAERKSAIAKARNVELVKCPFHNALSTLAPSVARKANKRVINVAAIDLISLTTFGDNLYILLGYITNLFV